MYLQNILDISKPLILTMALIFLKHTSCQFPSICMDRIVGGVKINITDAPYTVSVHHNNEFCCGGSIIEKCWVVTAAHCAVTKNPRDFAIRSGSTQRDEGGVVHEVIELVVHKLFNPENSENDIALMKVKPCFNFSATTQPVALPRNDSSMEAAVGMVTGWGLEEEDEGEPPHNLRCAMVPRVNKKNCVESYKGMWNITSDKVCYGYKNGTEDSCQGDSGGPLTSPLNILIGIVDGGLGCGLPNYAGVYTDPKHFLKWITKVISNNTQQPL
ncbi:hypothetical protein KM043_001067 [Ampulex compressa]|nr:hypothetical protein KM043_001067 [Ampulex compressa]